MKSKNVFSFSNIVAAIALSTSVASVYYSRSLDINNKKQLQAYLSLSSTGSIIKTGPDKDIFVSQLNIKNSGLTPAADVINVATMDILPYPLPSDYKFPEIRDNGIGSRSNLNAGDLSWSYIASSRKFSKDVLDQAKIGMKYKLYAIAKVRYTDAFGETKSISYCTFLDPISTTKLLNGKNKMLNNVTFTYCGVTQN